MRYSARDLGGMARTPARRAGRAGFATPALETWYHAHNERYALQVLSQRALAAAMPTVRCIDVRRLKPDEGLSPGLLAAIGQRLARGEQSLVFLNRRGYAPVLSCPSCGWVEPLPALFGQPRRASGRPPPALPPLRLRCGHAARLPQLWQSGHPAFGRGTQRVEARLAELFSQALVYCVWIVTPHARASSRRLLLATIAAGGADILVGTQDCRPRAMTFRT